MMDYIMYILIFMMGAVFGSFFTLAVYRIPIGRDITHEHSFCPECNHKLGILDLFPILSYIFLGGKCRYCGNKIKIRYLILEILSGITFLLLYLSVNINLYNIQITQITYIVFMMLYFSSLFIIAGIDKEKITIQKSVLLYGIIISATYMIYLYVVEGATIYRYIIYLLILIILLIIDTLLIKKKAIINYTLQILMLSIYMAIFAGEYVFILTAICTLLSICFNFLIRKINDIKNKYVKRETNKVIVIPIGFYLCISNIIFIISTGAIINYL